MPSRKNITLVTTALPKLDNKEKNIIFLGEWCHKRKFKHLKQLVTLKHHWSDSVKKERDRIILEKIYESILTKLSKNLNKIHKVKKDMRYWRIILGPWLIMYTVSMFDRWEAIRIFFNKYKNIRKRTLYFECKNNILYNFSTKDYVEKARENDLWNYYNYLRIIKFKYSKQINLKKIKFNNFNYANLGSKKKPEKSSYYKSFILKKILYFFDNLFSYIGIRYNKTVFESFYFSKTDLLRIFFKLKLIPAYYLNTFKEIVYDPKKYHDLNVRKIYFKNLIDPKSSKNSFINYLFISMRTDLPIAYLEKYHDIEQSNLKLNKLKKKLIITMSSYVFNERFKNWIAEMTTKGTKLHISDHGGFLPFKKQGWFYHAMKISDKHLTWYKSKNKKCINLSPVQLLKMKNLRVNKDKETCLILACGTARYCMKNQMHPYGEQYKIPLKGIYRLVESLKPKIRNKVVYRCMEKDFGFNMIGKFSSKFKTLKTQEATDSGLKDELKKTKIVICTYPETPVSEALISGIPTILLFPEKLYQLTKKSKKLLIELKKNKIYFENYLEASNHINKIWHNPDSWWLASTTLKCREKIKKYAFDIKDNWLDEWSNHIKSNV